MDFTFSELIKGFRERAGLKQSDLATALGVSRVTVSNWERAQYLPKDREMILRLKIELSLTSTETDQLLRAANFPEEYSSLALSAPIPQEPIFPSLLHQLRAPVGDFVGRAAEITQLTQTLRHATAQGTVAVITGVQGMGGIGKTELAYVVAQQVRDVFPDAQIVLPLGGASANPLTPEQALQTVLRAFTPDAKLPDDLPTLEAHYRTQLHAKRVLILADDARDARHLRPLHPPPGNALLITSRQRFTLPAMTTIDLEQLVPADARALLHSICLRLTDADAAALAHACGYLPLALRVSGSLLRATPALTSAAYLAKLADERQRLTHLRDPDDPQLDVAASLALSYGLLDADAQQVFRQLGVIVADFTNELAQAVVEMPDGGEIETMLDHLLRRNLIMYDQHRVRWRLHDLVRDLARQQLEQRGEAEMVHWRYAQTAIKIARETQEQYRTSSEGVLDALARFDTERPHIDAMHQWAMDHVGTPDGDQLLVDGATATTHIGELRYDVRSERIPQWEHVLAAAQRLRDRHIEGNALNNLGVAYAELGDLQRAIIYHEQRLIIVRALGNRHGEEYTLNNLGDIYAARGDSQHAIAYYEQSLTIARALGNQREEGVILTNLGTTYMELGDFRRAITELEHAITIARTVGDRYREGIALANLGATYKDLNDFQRALDSCTESRMIMHAIGDRRMEGYALNFLAQIHVRQGNRMDAITAFEQAITLFHDVGDRWGEADCQWEFGLALLDWQEREQALPLLRAAVAYEEAIDYAKASEHIALLARLEAGESLPPELHLSPAQRAIGDNQEAFTEDDLPP